MTDSSSSLLTSSPCSEVDWHDRPHIFLGMAGVNSSSTMMEKRKKTEYCLNRLSRRDGRSQHD
jgi:hypothetical protein